MGSFQEIGTNVGQAAPGESSPAALLTSRGQIIVCNSAGVPVALARPAAGLFLGSDGSDTLGRYPPGYLLARDAGGAGTPLNTVTETSVLNSTMAGALPAFVAAGDRVNLRAFGGVVMGATAGVTFNVYAGATKIVTGSASTTLTAIRGWMLDLWIDLLSSTTVSVSGVMVPKGPTGTGWGSAGDVHYAASDVGSAITVSALPLAIDIKAILGSATATSQVTCKGATATYHPKNY